MEPIVGIGREDGSRWERRTALVPEDVARLRAQSGVRFLVQPSPQRCFADEQYGAAGAELREDLAEAQLVLAVRELAPEKVLPGKVYAFFAQVVQGQPARMPLLRQLLRLRCSLIDYERLADDENRRLLSFGLHAGHAGMIDSLLCLGRRLAALGDPTALTDLQPAHDYHDLGEARAHLAQIVARLERDLPAHLRPLTIGVAGTGTAARGAREILDGVKVRRTPVQDLAIDAARGRGAAAPALLQVWFDEADLIGGADSKATLDSSIAWLEPQLEHVDLLIHAARWDARSPHLVTCEWARRTYAPGARPRLQVIGDLTGDIDGGVELTVKTTTPAEPAFVYDPADGTAHDGVVGAGPAIMALENLPQELPRDCSWHSSASGR